MGKNYLSIDFGTQNIKMAVGNLTNGSFIIEKLEMIRTPEDSYVEGKILEQEELSKSIKSLIEKSAAKCRDAAITLNSSNLITRELILPIINSKELDSMIRYEIKQQLPIEMDQYVVEYRILEEFEEEGIKKNRIFIAAVPKDIVEKFFFFMRNLGLNPVSMNINSNALSRLITDKASINGNTSISNDTVAIMDFGYKFISISIISKGKLTFSRMINQGSKDLDVAIASAFRVSLDEAEKIKKSLDLADAKEDINNEYQAVVSLITKWMQDTQRVVQFYEGRSNNRVSAIYIYGEATNLKGLAAHMGSVFNLPVETINGISSIKFSKTFDGTGIDIKNYLNAIGAIPKSR